MRAKLLALISFVTFLIFGGRYLTVYLLTNGRGAGIRATDSTCPLFVGVRRLALKYRGTFLITRATFLGHLFCAVFSFAAT